MLVRRLTATVPALICIVMVLCVPALGRGRAGGNDASRPGGATHVLIIGVDGLSPEGIERAEAPNLRRLISQGAWTMRARAQLPTSSSSNWASMITGAAPQAHGVTSNDWERDARTIEPTHTGHEDIFPTIFSRVRSEVPGARIASIYEWDGFGRLTERSVMDLDRRCTSPEEAAQAAVAWFSQGEPTLTFVHLDHVDGAGHAFGWSTEPYLQAVERADTLIGQMLAGLEDAGLRNRTVVIVSSDHGGLGTGHGGESMKELYIPWIIQGPGVAQGRRIVSPVITEDTAATAAHVLGVALAPAAIGRVVGAGFQDHSHGGFDECEFLPRPIFETPEGLHTTGSVEVTLRAQKPAAEIRYTTDGSEPTQTSKRYESPIVLREGATVRAAAFTQAGRSETAIAGYRVIGPEEKGGVRYARYAFPPTAAGLMNALPNFRALTPVEEGVVPEIMLTEELRKPGVSAARFVGRVKIPEAGSWTFGLNSDDGARIMINGGSVVVDDGRHGPRLRTGKVTLDAGLHDIVVEYFNGGGGAWLEIFYGGPGVPFQIIPTRALSVPQ
jgi:hypothetical protein